MKKQKIWPVLVASAVLLLAGLCYLSAVFVPKQVSNIATSKLWDGFYNEPVNSIDVVFVGPSTVYYGVSPTEIYEEYGFTSYALASPNQRMVLSELYIREAFKTQSPKVVVVDQTLFFDENIKGYEPFYRTALDHMKFSWNKLKTAEYLVSQDDRQSLISYVFPLFRYHSRWSDGLSQKDFNIGADEDYPNKGFSSGPHVQDYGDPLHMSPTDEIDDAFDANALEHLRNIIEICEENGAEFLLMRMPVMGQYTMARHNGIEQLAEETGIAFLDMNTEENWNAIGMDARRDFHSLPHLNYCGADKVASFLGQYISETFCLPDHRGDAAFSAWDKAVIDTRVSTMKNTQKTVNSSTGIAGATETESGIRVYWALPGFCEGVNLSYKDSTGETVTLLQSSTAEEAIFTDLPSGGRFQLEYIICDTDRTAVISFRTVAPSTTDAAEKEDNGE